MRLIIPSVLIAAAIGLFALYTNTAYQGTGGIQDLQVQVGAFDDALNKAQELKKSRDDLLSKRRTFAPDDEQKIGRMLPDNVDNIRLIIDINNIAARHNLSVKNPQLGTISDSKAVRSALAVGASGEAVGSVDVGFSITATYDEFLAFLYDLEHSLRIVDVERISFKPGADGRSDIGLTIRTYWLH